MIEDRNKLSRAVSHALRHEPWLYELELDGKGWASVESILVALGKGQPEWADLCEADLTAMIEGSSKRRHEVKDGRIRALYGDSIGKLKRTPATPPENIKGVRFICRLKSINHKNASGTVLASFVYNYDAADRRFEEIERGATGVR